MSGDTGCRSILSGVVRQYVLCTPLVDRGISKYSRIMNTSRPAYCRVTENIKNGGVCSIDFTDCKSKIGRFWPIGTFGEAFKPMYDSTVVALNVVNSSFVGVENNFVVNL